MSLRIVKASDPINIDRINMCLYSQPGLGKTTLAFSADEPLLLDFDKGVHRASNRKDYVAISSWSDVVDITSDDMAPYKTIIPDTAGRALDFLTADIIRENPKLGRGGALTLQGYGVLKTRFAAWLRMLNALGKDVVLICHMDEQRSGDDVIERLDVQGGSKGEIYKSVDAMGRIFVQGKSRVLDFSPRENSFGKNPGCLEPLVIPDPATNNHFLADTIAQIKSRINQLSEDQKEAQRVIEEWSDTISAYRGVDEFNAAMREIKNAPKAARSLFQSAAKSLGLNYNETSHCYEVAHANS